MRDDSMNGILVGMCAGAIVAAVQLAVLPSEATAVAMAFYAVLVASAWLLNLLLPDARY